MSGLLNHKQDVFVQDQSTPPLDLYFAKANAAPTTLAVAVAIGAYDLTVTDATSFNIGDFLGMFSGASGEGRFYFGVIKNKVGSVLTMDTPIDFPFQIGDPVVSTTRELNIDGSGAPVTFEIVAGGATAPIKVDITRIMLQMTTTGTPEFGDFGDITNGLAKGVVLRRVDGETRNIWNIKTNGEIANIAYDFTVYDPASPIAVNGIAARYTFAGQDKHGVVVRLLPGDSLELIIQDNLSALLSFRAIAQGHIVED
jgi:hypothetical protein